MSTQMLPTSGYRPTSPEDRVIFSDPRTIGGYTDDVRAYYRYCEYFYTNSIAGAVIDKLAKFAVSGLTIKSESEEAEAYAQKVLRKIRFKETLTKAIRDYQVYGMFVLHPTNKIKKTLRCRTCNTVYSLEALEKDGKAKYRRTDKGEYRFKCINKMCSARGVDAGFILREEALKSAGSVQVPLWSPNRITVSHNTITGDKQYVYEVEPEMKRKIGVNDHHTMCTMPEVFINAALNDMKIRMPEDRLFVYEAPTLNIHGIPIPPLARAFYHLGLLMKYMNANRIIAEDALIPLRILFPVERGTTAGAPLTQTIDLKPWKDNLNKEIDKFKKDKSYVPVMPVEVGNLTLWGDGKLLATHQEMRATIEEITTLQGVPIEFMSGGATWSRQNTSATVLQNTIKGQTDACQDAVLFIEEKINQDLPDGQKVEIKLNVPELVEAFSLLGYLAQEHANGTLSSETWFKHLGEDFDTEQRYKKRELENYAENRKMLARELGAIQYEQTKATLPLQTEQREIARAENLKDSIAMAGVERDASERQMRDQTRMQIINMHLQRMYQESDEAKQKIMADEQAQQQLAIMAQQMKLQEESQSRMGKEQMMMQAEGMKQQAVAQLEAQDLQERYMQNKEMNQIFESMPPEQQQQIMQMPEDQRMQAIQQYAQQMQYQQVEQSLQPEQKQEYDALPEEQKQPYLDNVMQQQQEEEAKMQDPNYVKAKNEEAVKYDPAIIQERATLYNRLSGDERKRYEEEMMQEDTGVYSKVKQTADSMATYEYVTKLLNTDPKESSTIWDEITALHPDIVDDVYNSVEQQILYMNQASQYAMQLHAVKDSPQEWQKMFDQLNNNTPEEFRKMIYNEYAKIVAGNKKEKESEYYKDMYVQTIAGSLQSMTPEERDATLQNIRAESPDLYSKVMSIYGTNGSDTPTANTTMRG